MQLTIYIVLGKFSLTEFIFDISWIFSKITDITFCGACPLIQPNYKYG